MYIFHPVCVMLEKMGIFRRMSGENVLPPIKASFGAIIHLSHEKRGFTGPARQASSGL